MMWSMNQAHPVRIATAWIFAFVLCVGFLFGNVGVLKAATCGGVGGICQTGSIPPGKSNACTDDQIYLGDISDSTLQALYGIPPGDTVGGCAGDCCIPKGASLCQRAGATFSPPSDPSQSWSCVVSGCTQALNSAGSLNQSCTGGQTCCLAKAPNCDEAAKQTIPSTLIADADCQKDVGACSKKGGEVVNTPSLCNPGVCCVVKTGSHFATCPELASAQLGGEQVETKCVDETVSCPLGYVNLVISGAIPTDCKSTEKCCYKKKEGTMGGATAPTTPTKPKPQGVFAPLLDPLGGATLFTILNRIITAFLGMVGAFAFAVFIYAGVTWMTAGSSDRVQHAKDTMKYAVIGLAMIALSYAITLFVIGALTRPASVGTGAPTTPEFAEPSDLE
jgi:hypothetical protein